MLGWNDAGEPVLLNQPDVVATCSKVSAKEHARWQFPSEYLYEEDEVLWFLTSHDHSQI
jgi:cupin superfamily acireductone dioxygenase involved in methionine salvage